MDLQWINGTDNVAEMATKTNVNFNALEEGVGEDILEVKAYADTVSATAKTEAISETQTWAKGTFSKPNLLIDGDFQLWLDGTSFVAPSNAYTATMWKCNGTGTVTKVANGMQITGTVTVTQIMEALEYNKISGKTVTLSYSLNGVVYTNTYIASSATVVNLTVTDKIINWIKLEEGNFRTPFESKPYGEELALCRRYYRKDDYNIIGGFYNANFVVINHVFDIPMRTTPTVKIIAMDGTENAISYWVSDVTAVTNVYVNASDLLPTKVSSLHSETGGFQNGNIYRCIIVSDARL